jgi:hypothetical protein
VINGVIIIFIGVIAVVALITGAIILFDAVAKVFR